MHGLLVDLFRKKGIEKVEELTAEEKAVYDRWNVILEAQKLGVVVKPIEEIIPVK